MRISVYLLICHLSLYLSIIHLPTYLSTYVPSTYLSLLPQWLSGKESACNAENVGLNPGLGRSSGGGNGQPTPVSLSGKILGTEEPGGLEPTGLQKSQTQLSK